MYRYIIRYIYIYIYIYIFILYISHICVYYISIYTNSNLPLNATLRHFLILGAEIARARKHF